MWDGELQDFVDRLTNLPTLPPIAIRILEVASDENFDTQAIIELVEADQALTARILRVANSPFFGVPREVSTVAQATRLLGMDFIRSMTLSILVVDCLSVKDGQVFRIEPFWQHSFACAIASELLAQEFGHPQPKEAFVAGLLHDLGKLILYQWDADRYESVVQEAAQTRTSLLEKEEEMLGVGHTRVSKMVMEAWRFPQPLVEAAWLHHQPPEETAGSGVRPLTQIVQLANSVCHLRRLGQSGNEIIDLDEARLLQLCQWSPEDFHRVSTEVLSRFEEVSGYFDWDNATPALFLTAVCRANEELGRIQADLLLTNQKLKAEQKALGAIFEMQEKVAPSLSAGGTFQQILRGLGSSVEGDRVVGFLPQSEESGVVIHWKNRGLDQFKTAILQWDADSPTMRISNREQFVLQVRTALAAQPEKGELAEVLELLENEALTGFALESSGQVLGQAFVQWAEGVAASGVETARLVARWGGILLERQQLVAKLESQSEELVRRARKAGRTQRQLHQVERLASVGRLAAGAAHEIDNPLTTILAHVHLLTRRIETDRDQKSLQVIKEQAERISKIIADLMGLAKPAEPHFELTDVAEVVERTLGFLEHRIRVSGIEIFQQIEESLPRVQADPKQLEQVFVNVCLNALQAMKEGGRLLTVRVGRDHQADRLRISFQDSGPGIPPASMVKFMMLLLGKQCARGAPGSR